MGLLARRNLFHDRVRFAVTLTGLRVDSFVEIRR